MLGISRKAKRFTYIVLLSTPLCLFTNCATIVSKSRYPISINSFPSGAKITITDKRGTVVYHGNTPLTLKLSAASGFFSKAR